MCRIIAANSNEVIHLYPDILLVPEGKQFIKEIAVANKLLLH